MPAHRLRLGGEGCAWRRRGRRPPTRLLCFGRALAARRGMKTTPTTTLLVGLSIALFATTGCVSKGKYDQAVAQTETTRAELTRKNALLEQEAQALAARQAEVDRLNAEIQSASGQSAVSKSRLAEMQKRLDELQAAQRAAEARAALYRDLTSRLKKQIDAGDLSIAIRDGRMVLQLPNDVLFDSGRTELKPAGKAALQAIAEVIGPMRGRHFQVSGHTDNVPIHTGRFPSNWELSTGRAVEVVHFLVGRGVPEDALSAAGYSEIDPVASNDSKAGRQLNRRTEIALQPNIDEMVKVP